MKQGKTWLWLALALALAGTPVTPQPAAAALERGNFRFVCAGRGIAALANPRDPFAATLTPADQPLGLVVRYRSAGGPWRELTAAAPARTVWTDGAAYAFGGPSDALHARQAFRSDGAALDWTIDLQSTGAAPVTVGDLAIDLPVVGPWGEEPRRIFERGFIAHRFIAGSGSFVFFVRASGAPPFLLLTTRPGTALEFADERSLLYIHSGRSGGNERRGSWRQPHTMRTVAPAGRPGSRVRYGFRLQWAGSYAELREQLFRAGAFDIRVVPGMTVPEDLTVRFALHTRARIEAVEAEFPAQTRVIPLGQPRPGFHLYEAAFRRLGENQLTIRHDGGRRTRLEFFVSEPLETLIKKRSSFIVRRQQVRDPAAWWDGVFAPWDMASRRLLTPAAPGIFTGRMAYVLTCDDPGLAKAPFVAEKNASFPDADEIAGLEYYLRRFVWGKLQRTDSETPYPYGVYGTPDWYTNRDPERRARYTDQNLDKMHVWRSYDYPHMVMLYFHMYEIASRYPRLCSYLDAAGYLERAFQTARAFYTYPYEIFPSYYETYKWGLYNELVVLKLADALEREGFGERAAWLRSEWEKKVKYFVYDDPYPFRSEYDFDRTAFESSYAFARYGATRDMAPDRELWWDVQKRKWYSHPQVRREDSRAFMERQLAANLAVRGWLEASYHQLGADGGLSYMAAMGGWGILDYALQFAADPNDWLPLGYASFLSSWCLVNSGRPDGGYGFWFPGRDNDGAAGWQFMGAKYGHAWMGADVARGPWPVDGEIDLGFGAALRMAATVVSRDPLFGWVAYGGALQRSGDDLAIIPRDGLRQRLALLAPDPQLPWPAWRRLRLELDRDGFAAGQAVTCDTGLGRIVFTLENRSGDAHVTRLRLALPAGEAYGLVQDGCPLPIRFTADPDYPWLAELPTAGRSSRIEIVRGGGAAAR